MKERMPSKLKVKFEFVMYMCTLANKN